MHLFHCIECKARPVTTVKDTAIPLITTVAHKDIQNMLLNYTSVILKDNTCKACGRNE